MVHLFFVGRTLGFRFDRYDDALGVGDWLLLPEQERGQLSREARALLSLLGLRRGRLGLLVLVPANRRQLRAERSRREVGARPRRELGRRLFRGRARLLFA